MFPSEHFSAVHLLCAALNVDTGSVVPDRGLLFANRQFFLKISAECYLAHGGNYTTPPLHHRSKVCSVQHFEHILHLHFHALLTVNALCV